MEEGVISLIPEWTNLNKETLSQPVKKIEDKWQLVPAYLKANLVMNHQIDSFNGFLNNDLRKIVDANDIITSEVDDLFYVKYLDIRVGQPSIETTPHECRLQDLTYSAPITVDIEYRCGDSTHFSRDLCIGWMPIMLKSCNCILSTWNDIEMQNYLECPLDPGGYFIVKGQEKVILIEEELSKNRMILKSDENGITCQVASSTHEKESITNIKMKNNKFYVKHTLTKDIPIIVLFRAMRISDQDIFQMIGGDQHIITALAASFEELSEHDVLTEDQALQFIGSRMHPKSYLENRPEKALIDEARDLLATKFLSHVPVHQFNFQIKALYLALMVKRVIEAKGDTKIIDDRDCYGNKRLKLAGSLLSLLFEDLFIEFNGEIKKEADNGLRKKQKVDAVQLIQSNQGSISNGLEMAISTGNWTIRRFKMERVGVTQLLTRSSYILTLGKMTRVNSQFEKNRKVSGPRSLNSQWGMVCPSDTPEGESCSPVKNLTLMTHITTEADLDPIIGFACNSVVEDINAFTVDVFALPNVYYVFLNGNIFGVTMDPEKFVEDFRFVRRNNYIGCFVSICLHTKHKCVYISSDGGRLCRPYLIVKDGKSVVKQEHICKFQRGLLSFQDFLLQGVCAGLIPYLRHNQSPRNTYQ